MKCLLREISLRLLSYLVSKHFEAAADSEISLTFFLFGAAVEISFQCHYQWTLPNEFVFLPCEVIRAKKPNSSAGFFPLAFFLDGNDRRQISSM